MARFLLFALMFAFATGISAQEKSAKGKRDPKRWGYPPKLAASRVIPRKLGDVELPIYIYNPPGHKPEDRRAAIVFFFGGGWKAGTPGQFAPQCEYFASRGMVAITADYRVATRHGVKAKDCVEDAQATIRFLRKNAKELGIDPEKIVASGGSAGGHIAACAGVLPGSGSLTDVRATSSVPNALALYNPAVILAELDGKKLIDPEKAARMKERVGTDPRKFSPAHHVRKNLPPTIIFHGTADTAVPYQTAEVFTELMQEAGNRCELVGFEDQGHGFFNSGRGGNAKRRARDDRMYRETTYRLDQFLISLGYLSGKPTIELPEKRPQVRVKE